MSRNVFQLIIIAIVTFTLNSIAYAVSSSVAANQEANRAENLATEIKINCLKEVKKTPFFYRTKLLALSYTAEQFAIIETWYPVKNAKPRKAYLLCMYDGVHHKAALIEADETMKY